MEEIVAPLLAWYRENARALPWREHPEAYTTWVSEIMLQQTRVEAVKPYYRRFLAALPDVAALAVCPEEQLLKLWEGLGYYSRVRNMQRAAREVMTSWGGEIPDNYDDLRSLPGIGDYTAAAIASIAWGQAVPVVDGNVLRVVSRLTREEGDVTKPAVKRRITEELQKIIPSVEPGTFNQAMMELGAMVCLPNGAPACERCPVRAFCAAAEAGQQLAYPVKPEKKARKKELRTILLLEYEGMLALEKRPAKGLLAGLYEPVNLEGHLTGDAVRRRLSDLGLNLLDIQVLGEAKHIFTHIEWQMIGYRVKVDGERLRAAREKAGQTGAFRFCLEGEGPENRRLIFVSQEALAADYPVPSAFSRIVGARRAKQSVASLLPPIS